MLQPSPWSVPPSRACRGLRKAAELRTDRSYLSRESSESPRHVAWHASSFTPHDIWDKLESGILAREISRPGRPPVPRVLVPAAHISQITPAAQKFELRARTANQAAEPRERAKPKQNKAAQARSAPSQKQPPSGPRMAKKKSSAAAAATGAPARRAAVPSDVLGALRAFSREIRPVRP